MRNGTDDGGPLYWREPYQVLLKAGKILTSCATISFSGGSGQTKFTQEVTLVTCVDWWMFIRCR